MDIRQRRYVTNIISTMHHDLLSGNFSNIKNVYKECIHKKIPFSYIDNQFMNYLNGFTMMHYAISSKNAELIYFLLNNTDIDINKKDRYGSTFLHQIAYKSDINIDIVKNILTNKKINVNIYNNYNSLPIETASFYGMKEYIILLLCKGSIYNVTKCIKEASYCNHTSLINWFQKRRYYKTIQFQCEYGYSLWSPNNHKYWSDKFKNMVYTMLLSINRKYNNFEKELLYIIFEFVGWY